jgi:hypothetical protein
MPALAGILRRTIKSPTTGRGGRGRIQLWTRGLVDEATGGEGEIRTPGTRKGSTVFETAAFDHSATSPHELSKPLKTQRQTKWDSNLRNP